MKRAYPKKNSSTEHATHTKDSAHARWVLLGAIAIDVLWGELPDIVHPVRWLGVAIDRRFEPLRDTYGTRQRLRGAKETVRMIGRSAAWAHAADRLAQKAPTPWNIVGRAMILTPSFACRTLIDAADRVAAPLEAGDLGGARDGLSWLCSRDPATLDATDLASATIASLAENSCDSAVASMIAWTLGGAWAAWALRAVNTLDAMVGYRGVWEDAGKSAAILDDCANYLPARCTGLLIVCAAAILGYDAQNAWRIMRRDHHKTPSPNGGWPMAAMAGALHVRIDKPGVYTLMPEGRDAGVADIRAAQRIARWTMYLSMLGAAIAARPRFGSSHTGGTRV